ncbi:hypothetical protein KIPB_007456 [Kipferlia bialata]|uniref:Uncharacterized protein n=1 Tax=Kipferlia bialata TaxID=797122 RepID=A0A9K3GKM0_9EUKA|nr:hypothetical protein KIPB_007456 [Kipferlia bialata]|eukprot:g7456.t1
MSHWDRLLMRWAPSTSILGTDTNHTGGALVLQAGSGEGTPASASGSVLIGTATTAALSLGSTSTTTTLNGAVVFSDPNAEVYIPSLRVGSLTAPSTGTTPLTLDSDAGLEVGTTSPIVDIGSQTSDVTIEADTLQVNTAQGIVLDSRQSTVLNVASTETIDLRVAGTTVISVFDEEETSGGINNTKARGYGVTITAPTTYTNTVTMQTGKALTVDTINTIGSNTLTVTAPTVQFSGDVGVGGDLTVIGASSLSTLGVTGSSTLASVGVTDAATVGGTLDVTGAATAASITATTGAFDTLSVTSGGSTVYSLPTTAGTTGQVLTYGASGPAWVSAGAASTDLTGTSLAISGASTLTTLGVSGASTLAGASFSNHVSIATGKDLTVDTIKPIGSNLSLTAPTVTISNALSVPSGTSTLSALSVTGAATLTSATLSSTLGVTGLSTLGSLTVTGASSLSTLTVTGTSTLDSVGVTTAATVGTTLDVTGAATAASVTATTGAFDTVSVTSGGSTLYSLPSALGTDGQVLGVSSSTLSWVTPSSGGSSADPYIREFTVTSGVDYLSQPYSVAVGDTLQMFSGTASDGTVHNMSQCPADESEDGVTVGIALSAANAGETVSVMVKGGIYTGFTGLSTFADYYTSWIDFQNSTTSGATNYIGKAMSATELYVLW